MLCCSARRRTFDRCTWKPRSGPASTSFARSRWPSMAPAFAASPPSRAYGVGGRQTRTGEEFGHIFDHMAVVYEFPNNVRCFAFCRQQEATHGETTDHVFGTKGRGNLLGLRQPTRNWPPYSITGE